MRGRDLTLLRLCGSRLVTAAVMVTARAFANVTTDRTIYFMLFGAEEQGLIGSEVFVEEFYETGEYVAQRMHSRRWVRWA